MRPTYLLRLVLIAVVAATIGPAFAAQSDESTLRVFIFAGQSNMVGSDSKVKDIEFYPPFVGLGAPQQKVKFNYSIGRENKRESDGWVALEPVGDVVGPELSFARRVAECTKAPIAIIKCASGGTHLGGDWNPDEPSGFKLYPHTLARVRGALAELERRRVRYRLEGFMWHQGENDMFVDEYRANYAKNLRNFIACWRRDLASPDLRFYVGELCTKTVWGMDHRSAMHDICLAQKEVCDADPRVDFVPTSHVGVEIGGEAGLHYHYGTLGQLEHGINHADAYLRNVGKLRQPERTLKVWPYRQAAKLRLFVLAGYRNMEGERAFVRDLAARRKDARLAKDDHRIAYRYDVGGSYKTSAGWEPLGPAGFYDTFGPELSFADRIAAKSREPFAVAKFTHSGSQIVDWTPEGSEAKSRNLHARFIAFIRGCVQDLKDKGHEVELAGVFYHLGENDMAYHPYRKAAAARLEAMIAGVRKDIEDPTLRFFVSQQPPPAHESVRSIDVLAAVATLAAADPNLIHVPALDLPEQREQLVLDAAGVIELGRLLADAYLGRR